MQWKVLLATEKTCLSIMSPTSGLESQPTGYGNAENQGRSMGNSEELESQITQKHRTKRKISGDQAHSNADNYSHMGEAILWREMGEVIHATCDKLFFHLLLQVFL